MNNNTNIYEFQDAYKVVVCGDIHGDFTGMVFKCCVQYGLRDTLIVVAGDCGFGFQKPGYFENQHIRCRNKLEKYNNRVVFVRGNHDNPAYFDGKQVNHERWKAVPDYSILKACGHTILCVGGATSVDREWRQASEYHHFHPWEPLLQDLYWPDETPVYDEAKLEAISEACTIDTVITHTAPSFCELSSYRRLEEWGAEDPTLIKDVKKERKVMDDIHTFLKDHCHPVDQWYYGHFHQSWHQEIEGVKYNMLDCLELHELK